MFSFLHMHRTHYGSGTSVLGQTNRGVKKCQCVFAHDGCVRWLSICCGSVRCLLRSAFFPGSSSRDKTAAEAPNPPPLPETE